MDSYRPGSLCCTLSFLHFGFLRPTLTDCTFYHFFSASFLPDSPAIPSSSGHICLLLSSITKYSSVSTEIDPFLILDSIGVARFDKGPLSIDEQYTMQ